MPLSGLTFSGQRLEYKHRVGKYKVEIKKVTMSGHLGHLRWSMECGTGSGRRQRK
jgi:hypothetical protein